MEIGESEKRIKLVVVGGGIGGVSCAQELSRLNPENDVILISESDILYEAQTIYTHTQYLKELSVFQRTVQQFQLTFPHITIIRDNVYHVDIENKLVMLKSGSASIYFDKLCIAVGARPNVLVPDHPRIIGLRDNHSFKYMISHLQTANNVCVIGNGGIALELVHELTFCNVCWVVKDDFVGSKFFDATASAFIMPRLQERMCKQKRNFSSTAHTVGGKSDSHYKKADAAQGYSLGPDWAAKSHFEEFAGSSCLRSGSLMIEFEQEIVAFSDQGGLNWNWLYDSTVLLNQFHLSIESLNIAVMNLKDHNHPLLLFTSKAKIIGCDVLISATGVIPNTEFLTSQKSAIQSDSDGFIIVNDYMESSSPNIYAVGDCSLYQPSLRNTFHFFQMPLWSQARLMGTFAAQCMSGVQDDYGTDTQLELFAHITRFFGHKVVLLGRYNGQGFGDILQNVVKRVMVKTSDASSVANEAFDNGLNELEIWIRITPNEEYVKVLVYKGKIVGALLIGDTGMEETMENLILNHMDVTNYGIALLDPDIDITDYFD